ncbi:3,4-dihydroxy-2-butanone-4-phosphate synthase [Urechidicola vernalis]|uniref:3,4-dihydroxy-2-butanone 4-phosphate synthase n=1 Tax=Urechidicola vernalis TaxID=3075600 RepID=A0ABU2Y1S5_9FLAO|nr:3,4-dihydroxy-2-butanone-4-phosphate synthase [Urechidicola sp. P050]MDT0552156.1 3,4-dihydroxy-2-butanone-4-phosphate synthase [Urechidicola sp. P050]
MSTATKQNLQLNTIEDAIEDIKNGKVVIVVDDENRENEGDFIAAAEMVTPEMINFMATHGRGLICAPLTETRCKELDLEMMVQNNTVMHHTQFTVSVDLIGHGCTTGISVHDRAKTIKSLVNPETKGFDLGRPGHIFPLRARNGGVLRRTGHTEAAVDLARLAGFDPAGILVEILNEDGTMARLPQLVDVAKQFDLKLISIEDLVAYRMQHDSLIEKIEDFETTTRFGDFRLRAYKQTNNNQVHIALTKGSWKPNDEVLVKVNSTLINNALGVLTRNSDEKFNRIFDIINKEKAGVVVFINQDNKQDNFLKHLSKLKIEDHSKPKVMDKKDYGIGAQILHDLGVSRLKVITNAKNTSPRVGMTGYGLEVTGHLNY